MDIVMDKVTADVLAELEKTQKDFWNVPRKTGVLMNSFIKMMNIQNALEIGTSNGYSGIWLAKALKQTGGKLTTIEFYEKRQSIAKENFKICGVDDVVRPIQGSACEVLASFDENEKFDFVFIDANKAQYIKDFELIHPLLKVGGIIVADDILSHADPVKPFVDEIMNREDYSAQILNLPDGVLIARKNK